MRNHPKVWLVRAGRHGEDEELCLSTGRAIIGWREHGDLSKVKGIDEAMAEMRAHDTSGNEHRVANFARQFWAFRGLIQPGDIIVLPLKTRPGQIALGLAEGDYEYAEVGGSNRHSRRVKWVRPDVARSTFKEDLLLSFGALMTVCRIQRNHAEERVNAVLSGNADPGYAPDSTETVALKPVSDVTPESVAASDLAQAAQDEVVAFIRTHFKAHDLARLIGAILSAEGYLTHVSPPGPDGGADILAGRGALGLDSPTLCVQVKATESAADVKILRELIGAMNTFKADQGLLVCWGGFTQPLKIEARQHSFKLRLWDQSNIVTAVYRAYERLDPEIQAELPLKQVWMLVREDIEEA